MNGNDVQKALAAIPHVSARGGGRIVNISSIGKAAARKNPDRPLTTASTPP